MIFFPVSIVPHCRGAVRFINVTKIHSNLIRILIVDDDPLVLSSLRAYFASTEDIQVVAEACDGVEALSALDDVVVDIVLADIHMPRMNGVLLLHEVKKRPDSPIFVALTSLDTDSTMLDILAGGGAGYIVKSSRPQAIIAAVYDAMAGGTTVSPQSMKRLVTYLSGNSSTPQPRKKSDHCSPLSPLTGVEKAVLDHLCDGKSNAEIAMVMNYSESTVKKHVSHLISLFGAQSRLSRD